MTKVTNLYNYFVFVQVKYVSAFFMQILRRYPQQQQQKNAVANSFKNKSKTSGLVGKL